MTAAHRARQQPPHRRAALYLSGRCLGSREVVFLRLVEHLLARGWNVDVLAAGPEPWLREQLPPGARLEDLARWRRLLPGLPHLLRAYASAPAVAGYLRRAQPDVLLGTSIPPNLACLLGRALAGTPTPVVIRQSNVIRIAGDPAYGHVRRRPRDWLLPALYRRAQAVIAVSAGVADNLRRLGADGDAMEVIPNGIDLARIDEAAARTADHPWLRERETPIAVAVGRLVAKKDYPTLFRALARVRRTQPLRLIVLGDGPERPALETLRHRLGLEQAISLPGFHANPFAFLARADVFALSSISEGMPSSLLEALACRCPAVSTDCPSGPAEILEPGRQGLLVPMADPEALAAALLRVLERPPAPERLRERAEQFSQEACVAHYAAVLERVAGARPKAGAAAARELPR